MTATEVVRAARTMLQDLTPLQHDCGRLCGSACCLPDENGRGSMRLFPGERALVGDACSWATVTDDLVTCNSTCPRQDRPLACRIFPLRMTRTGVEMDIRAWPICPLMEHGQNGLSRAFVEGVEKVAEMLRQVPEMVLFLEVEEAEIARYRTL